MLDLEGSGISVVWQDLSDRKAILLANQRDLSNAIAVELHLADGTANYTTASDTIGEARQRHTAVDPGLQQLVNF